MSSLKNLGLTLLVTICLVLALEAVARVVTSVDETFATNYGPAEETDWFVWSRTIGWERRPGFKGWSAGADRSFDANGFLTVDSQQVATRTGHKRVVFHGDSNTFGFGVPANATFAEVVDALLPDVDTINLGLNGYTSYQGLETFEKYAPVLRPDLVVVSFNYNDRRYVPPGEEDGPATFARTFEAAQKPGQSAAGYLEAFHLFRGARFVARKAHLMPPKPPATVRLDTVVPRVDEAHYRANLERIARECQKLGIPVVFLLLGDNPVQSWHLHRGIEYLNEGKYSLAAAHLRVGRDSVSAFSDLSRIYLSKTLLSEGDRKNADRALSVELTRSLHGAAPIRLDTTYQAIMREVAAQYGIETVDATPWEAAHPEDFIDMCHLDAVGHRAVGELLAPKISQLLSH